MRRSTAIPTLLLLVTLVACGGDDESAAPTSTTTTTTAADEETTTTTAAGESESEPASEGDGSTDAYADGVCRSISSWYDEIESASTALVADAESLTDEEPAVGKELALSFLDDAIGLTDGLIADLEEAGVPDTESGPETADRLVVGISDVRVLFQGARDDTAALPADDPLALGTGLQDIGATLEESAIAVGDNLAQVLSSVQDPELADAFESAASCQELATIG